MSPLFLGLDIGGTQTSVVLGNDRAETLAKISFATDHKGGPEAVIGQIKRAIQELRESGPGSAPADGRRQGSVEISAVGISCGGPLDSRLGLILGPPNLPGWDRVPIVQLIRDYTGLPTYLENDANAGALAEWRFGAGRGRRNVIFITAGTGFGCGLIMDDRLYRGTNEMAGEAGHIRLARYGPQGYGKFGSLEGFCSGGGIARLGLQMLLKAERRGQRSTLFRRRLHEPLTAKIIAEAAQRGDALAQAILREAGKRLGQGLAILIDILNPEVIVLGSLAVRLGELYLGPARELVAREALRRSTEVCQIVPAQLGERIGEVAALCVAMRLGC